MFVMANQRVTTVYTALNGHVFELQFRTMTEPQLEEHATCAAEYFWLTVRNDLSKDTMEKEDVVELLSGKDEANVAFGLFDLNSDGYVTEPEVHSRFQYMYRYAGCHMCHSRSNHSCTQTHTG